MGYYLSGGLTVDPLLTIKVRRQLVATHGNGFGVILPFSALSHLPPVATGCDRWAPLTLHRSAATD